MEHNVGLGLLPHTGWTWLVRVCAFPEGPRVESRARVVACDVLEGELYHLAAAQSKDRASFVERRRRTAVEQAREALGPFVSGARAAIVLGKRTTLPALERVLAAHPMIHGAEGELWRAVFAEACGACGLAVARLDASAVHAAVAERHGRPRVDAFLAEGRRAVGPPWSREPQEAALAAWHALE